MLNESGLAKPGREALVWRGGEEGGGRAYVFADADAEVVDLGAFFFMAPWAILADDGVGWEYVEV